MKTTVELPDELLIEAKKQAAELRRPLRAILESALRRELIRLDEEQVSDNKIEWVTATGGLPPELDISDREKMSGWLREDP
jgi:hypothetical protein